MLLNVNENRFKVILLMALRSHALTPLHLQMLSWAGEKEVQEEAGLWATHNARRAHPGRVSKASACAHLQTKGGWEPLFTKAQQLPCVPKSEHRSLFNHTQDVCLTRICNRTSVRISLVLWPYSLKVMLFKLFFLLLENLFSPNPILQFIHLYKNSLSVYCVPGRAILQSLITQMLSPCTRNELWRQTVSQAETK